MNFRRILTVAAMGLVPAVFAADVTVNGAGASFPAPVYRAWTYAYGQSTNGSTLVNYQSMGSSAGIKQIKARTVDFGGSDSPLTSEELKANNLVQFPMLTGGVVVIANVPGVANNQLKLDQATLANIFLGKITKWNDPAIAKLNPELNLPSTAITVVRRADGSGTTFIFTNYLSKISKEWADNIGAGTAVKWAKSIGGKGNPGVCNNVSKISGAIGYTEYTYAVETKIPTVQLMNKAGKFVAPTPETFTASAANADWDNAPGFYMVLTDQPGEQSWPITGVTYVLVQKEQTDAKVASEMLKYFNWCYTTGAPSATKLQYVPLPENVVKSVRAEWAKSIRCNGEVVKY